MKTETERAPEAWWYFKNTRTASMKDQEAAASIHVSRSHWLGESLHAGHNACKDVTKLLYTEELAEFNASFALHPIRSGDTLWIYNLACLGSTAVKVLASLKAIDQCNVHLKIYTIDLDESIPHDRYDYLLMTRVLEQVINSRAPAVRTTSPGPAALPERTGKLGRKPLGISYDTLTPEGKRLIRRYADEKKQDFEVLYESMQASEYIGKNMWGEPVHRLGKNKLREIIREYRKEKERRSGDPQDD